MRTGRQALGEAMWLAQGLQVPRPEVEAGLPASLCPVSVFLTSSLESGREQECQGPLLWVLSSRKEKSVATSFPSSGHDCSLDVLAGHPQ